MYQILNPTGRFDRSPFHYARMDYLKGRVEENLAKYREVRRVIPGRMDSSHLLMKILLNLAVPFSGDLTRYMAECEGAAKRLCSGLGISSSFSKGDVFTEGLFYPECPEIVIYSRNHEVTAMDLWKDWRSVTPIKVLCHPISQMTIVELGAKNPIKLSGRDLAVISIDIPLLAGQWKMWQAANPGKPIEEFVTCVPIVGMMESHLNVAFFNKLQVKLGIRKAVTVNGNLVFAQTPVDQHADALIDEVIDKVSNKKMTGNQILDSIPALYGPTYLTSVTLPSMSPTNQVIWALIAQKMEAAAVVLEFGKLAGYDRMLHELTVIRRFLIENASDQILSNGLTTAVSTMLVERLNTLVVERLPAA